MPLLARSVAALSISFCAFTVVGGASAHPAPAPHMRWSLDVKNVPVASGPTDGAKLEEFRLIKLKGVDEAYGGYFEYGFRGLHVGETGDRPCGLKFVTESLEMGGSDLFILPRGCAKGEVNDWKSAFAPVGAFIRSVAVCTNAENTRVKGVRLGGVKFDAAGKPVNVNADGFERSNCKNWQAPATCGAGEIAVAIRAYYKDDALTALGLECRPAYSQPNNPHDFATTIVQEGGLEPYGPTMQTQKFRVKIKNTWNKTLRFSEVSLRPDHTKMAAYSHCVRKTEATFEVEPGKTFETTLDVWCKWDEALPTIAGCAPGAECAVPIEYAVNVAIIPVRRDWYQNEHGTIDAKMKRPQLKAGSTPASPK